MNHSISYKNTYDERQILARGKAYQTAFIVLVGYVLAASCLDEFFYCPQLMSFGGLWLGVCLSILVYVYASGETPIFPCRRMRKNLILWEL